MELQKYRGFEINFSERDEVFIAERSGESYRDPSIKSLKKKLDDVSKQNLGELKVYHTGWGDSLYEIWKVTSIANHRSAWISKGTSREKADFNKLFPVTEHNTGLISEIHQLQKDRNIIDTKIENLQAKLKEFTPPADQVN